MRLNQKLKVLVAVLLVATLGSVYASSLEQTRVLTSSESDPRTLQWMQGFPPPPDKRIMQPESDFFSFPKMRWSVCHIRELMPTTRVSRGVKVANQLPDARNADSTEAINALTFTPLNQSQEMTWQASLAANYTDGIIVLHQGEIVYEYYSGCLNELGKHAAMSMTKSLTGLLAEILVAEGQLDETNLVGDIVPELQQSAFADATVRQVMDMTTALDFSENYADPQADIWQYSAAASPLPKPSHYDGPNGYFEYLATVRGSGEHGHAFGYKTVNSDTLGWIIARTTGKPVNQLLSERIWQPMGAEQDAYMTVDALGTPFAGGGLSAGLRDMARLGLLMLNDGKVGDTRLFSEAVVSSIRAGGDKEAFAKAGYEALPGGSYRSMWWVFHNANGAYAARGVHGQTVYVDPAAEMVLVRFASHPQASNSAIDPTSLPAYEALAEFLKRK